MKLNEQLKMLALAMMLPAAFAACDDNENPEDTPEGFYVKKGVYVYNSGNQGSAIEGSLSVLEPETGKVTANAFTAVNARSLGNTVQDGTVLGRNLYIAVFESNTIEVADKNTLLSVAQIKPAQPEGQPRDIVTDGKYLYASLYTGSVARIDPATNTIDKTVKVGPNPEEMAVVGNYLYVTNSDGNNYANNYANGKTVSKVNLTTFTEEKKISVGLNPTKIAADQSGKLFVLCMGNYGDTPASIWAIDAQDQAADWQKPATLMAADGNTLYTINAPYGGSVEYTAYDTRSGSVEKQGFVATPVDSPAGIAVNPQNGNLFISSYTLVDGFASYNTPGYVNEYTPDGTLVKRYDAGVGPCYMSFLN